VPGRRPEPLPLSLSSSDRDVRAFGANFEAFPRHMGPSGDPKFAERRAVDLVLVGHPLGRGDPLLLEELPHQLASGRGVAFGLDKHVQDLAFGIHGSPKVHLSATDPDEDFVEVPSPVRDWASRPQAAGDCRPEHDDPSSDRLVRHLDTALGQQVLDVAKAEREPQVHPDGALDHVARKAVTRIRDRSHSDRLRRPARPSKPPGNVTSPITPAPPFP